MTVTGGSYGAMQTALSVSSVKTQVSAALLVALSQPTQFSGMLPVW